MTKNIKTQKRPADPSTPSAGQAPAAKQALRQRAEAQLRKQPTDRRKTPPEEARRLLHELQVHQIELEMQNEELRRAQQEIETSRAKYVDLFDFAPVGYLTISETGIILEANLTAANLLGIEKSQLVKKQVTRFIAREDQDIYYLHRKQIFETRARQVYELRMVRKGSVPFWVNIEAIALPGSDGDATVCRATLSDITARKQAEEALRESELKSRGIVEQSSDGIVLADEQGIIVEWNKSQEQITDIRRGDALGKPIWNILYQTLSQEQKTATTYERFITNTQSLLSVGEAPWLNQLQESVIPHSDGTRVSVQAVMFPIRTVNGLMVASIVRDITAHKQAEETSRHRLADLEALHTVSTALRTAQTLDEALPLVLDQTLAALAADAGTIWIYHPASRELRVALNRGWFCQLDEIPIKPGEGIAGTVFASGQAHLSAEFARDPLARPLGVGEIPAGWGGACVPIRTAAETVGVLFVSVPLPRQITPEQMNLLDSLAEMAGTALHRMRLYEEIVRHLKYLQALREIDRVISASFDLRMTLNLLIDHVIAQLGVDAAAVLLLHPHRQTLDYAAGHGFRTRAIQDAHLRLGEDFAGRVAVERRPIQVPGPVMEQENAHLAAMRADEKFVAYYGIPLIFKGQVKGVLEVYHRTPFSQSGEKSEWSDALESFAAQAAIAIENAQLFEDLERSNLELAIAYDTTIEGWARSLEVRARETEGHARRVAEMTVRLAKALNLGDADIVNIRRGALLHDIGKIGVPDSILVKPDKLTDDEWVIMRQHPQLAHDLLAPIAYLHSALDIPYCHREKWDGTGYPRGLQGEQIPLAARIFAAVDVYDALTSERPYRKVWTHGEALEYIREQSGKHFDPQIVEMFLREIARE